MSSERKIIGYKTRTIIEAIYEDKLVKYITMEIRYEINTTNPNATYIPINICLK